MARLVVGKDIGSYTFDASAKTITFGGLGTIRLEDIFLIYNLTSNTKIFQFASSGLSGSVAGDILTLDYDTTSMADTDILQIFYEQGSPEIDFDLGANRSANITPEYARYTDPEVLVTAQDLTGSYADFGAEIDMQGYDGLNISIVADVNDSENVKLKVLGKMESGGTDEYEIDGNEITLWTTGASDFKKGYDFDPIGYPHLQLQAFATTPGSTVGDLTITITKRKK